MAIVSDKRDKISAVFATLCLIGFKPKNCLATQKPANTFCILHINVNMIQLKICKSKQKFINEGKTEDGLA